jgi:hypothetical protein
MDIPVKAEVICTDGPGGRVERVVIDPIDLTVVGLVVREPGLLIHDVLVPLEAVVSSSPAGVMLGMTRDRLSRMPPFVEHAYLSYSTSRAVANQPLRNVAFEGNAVLMPFEPIDEDAAEAVESTIPPGDLLMRRGDRVQATDGHVGSIESFLVDRKSRAITHLTLSAGHLWGKRDVCIPVSQIERMEDSHVYLTLSKAEVEALPAVSRSGSA